MNNNLTPCQQLGYQEGDLFMCIQHCLCFNVEYVVILERDDNTNMPLFATNKQGRHYNSSIFKHGSYEYLKNLSNISNYFEDIFNVSDTEISLFSLAFGLSIEEAKNKVEEAIELKTIWNEHKGISK